MRDVVVVFSVYAATLAAGNAAVGDFYIVSCVTAAGSASSGLTKPLEPTSDGLWCPLPVRTLRQSGSREMDVANSVDVLVRRSKLYVGACVFHQSA